MAVLAAVAYDPATAASLTSAVAAAMTAVDTTNLRLTFTAPANGSVLVRIRATEHGTSGGATLLFGVLDGATVKGRMLAQCQNANSATSSCDTREVIFVVSSLTPGNSYTWDAAVGFETAFSDALKWGGPNNATTNDAFGAFVFEIWETTNLLGAALYDPAGAVTQATDTLQAMTAMDTTNLRLTFTAPASGKVLWRIRTAYDSIPSGTIGTQLFGILEGATVRARQAPLKQTLNNAMMLEANAVITGLTPGNSYTFDAALGVETISGNFGGNSNAIRYGGPNDATAANAWGGIAFEVWKA